MLITEEMTQIQEMEFNVLYGSVFGLTVAKEYCDALQSILTDKDDRYTLNATKSTHRASNELSKLLLNKITRHMNNEQRDIALKAIEHHHSIIYDFFSLDVNEQNRVKSLINKIKREKQ